MERGKKKLAVTVDEACDLSSLGRTYLWNAIWSGELVSYRAGRRRLVRVADLDRWIRAHRASPRDARKDGLTASRDAINATGRPATNRSQKSECR